MGLAKPKINNFFVFLTLTTEEARDIVLKEGLAYNNERSFELVQPSSPTTSSKKNHKPPSRRRSNNFFGADNIMRISFGTTNQDTTNKQAGWCHKQCLNTAVYTEWIHKSTFILGRRIDFILHRGSIDGSDPNKTAICLAQAPAREAIADKIQAMENATNLNPFITKRYLTKTIKKFEDKLDERFGSLSTTINKHTDKRHDETTTTECKVSSMASPPPHHN